MWGLGALCSILYRSRFSRSCWAYSFRFSLLVEKKTLFVYPFLLVFWITADRDCCSNFVGCKSISPIRLGRTILYKAFVRFRLLMIWYSIMLSAKEAIQPRLAQIPRKILAKTPRSRILTIYPPIMKNERPTAQRNLLKRKRYRPEHRQLHQIPNWGLSICTGNQLPKWVTSPRQPTLPRRSGSPRVGRVRVQRIGKEGFANPAVPVLWCAARQQ